MNNFTSQFKNNSNSTNNQKYSTILMKNCGLDPLIFNDMQKYVYVYEKNPMKKVFSSNAVLAIPINEEEFNKNNQKKPYVAEDKELYEREELNKIIDNNILRIDLINQNQKTISNQCKKMSAFEENSHLSSLLQNINNDVVNNNTLINSYKSKIKSKFLKIYDINSINIQGKLKYKLFHKCCFPGCNRTFSSSGWLKAHFKEHLKQLRNSKFSLLFNKYVYKEDGAENHKERTSEEKDKDKSKNIINNKKSLFIVNKESI